MSDRPEQFRIYDGHPLAQGLVFAGLGRHVGSTHYHDSSLYKNAGLLTSMDPPTDWVWVPELGRWASVFHADSGFINGGDPAPVVLDSVNVTVACWCKTVDYTRSFNGGVARGRVADGGSGFSWELLWRAAGAAMGVSDITNTTHYSPTVSVGDNKWHHWAGTFNGTRISIYKDGVESGTDWTGSIDYTKTNNYFRIGWGYMGGFYSLDGQMADACVHNRALPLHQIQQLADPSNAMLSGLILPPRRRLFASAIGGVLTVTEDTFQNSEPFPNAESIGTAAATGGTSPYTWEIISQNLL